MTRLLLASLTLLSLSACSKDDTTETGDSTVEELPPWSEMTDAQKSTYMATDVTPQMAEIFKAYDADYYADFGCATCHGADAATNGYAMPSDIHDLSVPPPEASAGPTAEFMHNEVVPKMAELLDMEVYDGTSGFGCYGCHSPEE